MTLESGDGVKRWQKTRVAIKVIMFVLLSIALHHARANHIAEEITFQSGDVTLYGTILIPDGEGPYPALVLVHGAGLGLREDYRKEAEAFASTGILTLIYDKRTQGYSATGTGGRSYALLADDVLEAVKTLQSRKDINKVGLWGLSEGAWVAPLAASHSDEIDFLVLVGASGVPPAQQEAWHIENKLRHQGVSGSLVYAVTRSFMRLLVAAELFPEARYNPMPVLDNLQQPILALWGAMDCTAVPAESAQIMQAALESRGRSNYIIMFFSNADHELYQTPDGFLQHEKFASGYIEKVSAWVHSITKGEVPGSSIDQLPLQERKSPASVVQLPWYESGGWLQLGIFIFLVIAFMSYLFTTLVRYLQRRRIQKAQLHWLAYGLAITGLISVLGLFVYLFLLFMSNFMVGPLLAGRTIPWLILQLLAVMTSVLTISLLLSWLRHKSISKQESLQLTFLLMGGLLFIPWAFYWKLLIP
jgi:uncharacterized protein